MNYLTFIIILIVSQIGLIGLELYLEDALYLTDLIIFLILDGVILQCHRKLSKV